MHSYSSTRPCHARVKGHPDLCSMALQELILHHLSLCHPENWTKKALKDAFTPKPFAICIHTLLRTLYFQFITPHMNLSLLIWVHCPHYYLGGAKNSAVDEKVGKEEVGRWRRHLNNKVREEVMRRYEGARSQPWWIRRAGWIFKWKRGGNWWSQRGEKRGEWWEKKGQAGGGSCLFGWPWVRFRTQVFPPISLHPSFFPSLCLPWWPSPFNLD